MAHVLLGKVIKAVFLTDDRRSIVFLPVEGGSIVADCEADCCSDTWIETIEGAEDLIGNEIFEADDIDLPGENVPSNYRSYTDVVAFYGFRIATMKGETIIDYRNDSNGYYGGCLTWSQHKSDDPMPSERWELIAGART